MSGARNDGTERLKGDAKRSLIARILAAGILRKCGIKVESVVESGE